MRGVATTERLAQGVSMMGGGADELDAFVAWSRPTSQTGQGNTINHNNRSLLKLERSILPRLDRPHDHPRQKQADIMGGQRKLVLLSLAQDPLLVHPKRGALQGPSRDPSFAAKSTDLKLEWACDRPKDSQTGTSATGGDRLRKKR